MAEVVANNLRFHLQRLDQHARRGQGPVVFVHGLVMDNLSSWYFTAGTRLANQREVLLYDLRGHGKSQRPAHDYTLPTMVADLRAILQQLHIEAPVGLVGNSFGGLLALAFASAFPERVERLMLVDAHYGAQGWAEEMAATLALQGEAADRRIADSFKGWLGRHSARKTTRLAQTARDLVYNTSLVADLKKARALDAEALGRIHCPVLAIYGEASDLRQGADHLAEHLPDCHVRIYQGCTHSVLWEATERVITEICDWFS
jgi:pimeloyl-ACP methyl ester carboxylesterase